MDYFPSFILRNRVLNKLVRIMHRDAPARLFKDFGEVGGPQLQRLGSDYGGWLTPVTVKSDWIVYSLGIGQDATFDQAIIDRYGVTVHGFDPTPTAIEYVALRRGTPPLLPEQFQFTPVGIWDSDCSLRFYEPKTRGWVGSYSALNLQGTSRYIEVPCRSLSTLMRERGHDHIDLLKMDIEGAEYRIINQILDNAIPIGWICVEFDQPVPIATTRRMLTRLADNGFVLRHVDHWNFTFENCLHAL